METKICKKCGKEKSIKEFYKRKDSGNYLFNCKKCQNEQSKKWASENIAKVREYKNKHYLKNKEEFIKKGREWIKNHPEEYKIIVKNWRIKNLDRCLKVAKEWRTQNREIINKKTNDWKKKNRYKVNISKRIWENNKKKTDIQYNLNHKISNAILKTLKYSDSAKNNTWQKLVNYTKKDLKNHLEKQFKPGMTWGKFLKGEIHIDHIIPKSLFQYNSPNDREFKQCWSLANLQPLWSFENLNKGAKCT